ncbi:5' nucleotidase, NT5C type [Dyadobacter psychrotolerans]|uniref:5'(3')-deoxyribonucleotidase n=1 Tax=Dyadobacter psychrotolerans TaxID=2541721 RepID=A0A4R5DMY3_9BACT|nr:5'(3')-deoxyribonucleotidase [Dyadobacter psychrotolerans]TDE15529.1 5'(3')-deoxyribonucleotidase [Dyadobacter psychrotolerans]
MLRLTLDMDDVLANTHEKLIQVVLNDFSTNLSEHDLKKGALKNLLHPKQLTKLHKMMNSPGFFADIAVKEDSVETVYALSRFYEIFIATACMEFPNSFKDKFDWLGRNFSFIPWTNIVFCGYKSIINSDYLIDDHTRNLAAFNGEGILFTAAHNLNDKTYRRVSDWKEVSELFLPIV